MVNGVSNMSATWVMNEASQAIFCFGDDVPMRLIRRKLIVGEALGRVPAETPSVPLMQDLERLQKRLRLPPDPAQTTKVLDLREANDLERSRLLHRLGLLDVPWGRVQHASGKGTFKEAWGLQWQPEFAVALIEASLWGTTVLDAATAAHAERAWVVTLEQVLDGGWLGPRVTSTARSRLGDVAVVARDPVSFDDPADTGAIVLRCRHGSLTAAEVRVPLLAAGGA